MRRAISTTSAKVVLLSSRRERSRLTTGYLGSSLMVVFVRSASVLSSVQFTEAKYTGRSISQRSSSWGDTCPRQATSRPS